MSDMPERIWAWFFMPSKQDDVIKGGWDDNSDARLTEYTRTDLTTAKLAQALARAEAAETALEAEMPWTIETPNLEEYGHAIARAALEKAEILSQREIDRGDKASEPRWAAGSRACRDAIRAIADDPAALAEIVKGVKE